MASIIIFATLWGVILHEWKGTSKKTHALITGGIIVLVMSTIVVGVGNYLKKQSPAKAGKPSAALVAPHRAA
jgi:L-rhamnose-H+ transport protein